MSHPPACATTLIISLGILPEWSDGLVIFMSVIIIYLFYYGFQKSMGRKHTARS
jgi:hypothetical protein